MKLAKGGFIIRAGRSGLKGASQGVRDVLALQSIFGAVICFTFALFSKGQGFSALCGALCIILPNILLGFVFSLVGKEGLVVVFSAIKVALIATLLAMCFIFFCHQNRRFLRGDGGSLPGPHLLWLAWPAKVLMIAKKVNRRFEGSI